MNPPPLPWTYFAHPFFYVFALLMVNLLCLEWLWRISWSMVERPAPFRHPVSVMRAVLFCLLLSILCRTLGDGVLSMSWVESSPARRSAIFEWDKVGDLLSFFPLSLAWVLAWTGDTVVGYQLRREPIPIHLWPTWERMKRPLKIGLGVGAISFAVTFLR